MADHPYLHTTEDGVLVDVHVQPGAHRARVVGRYGDALKLAVAVPPLGDRANEAVVKAIAEMFGVPLADVTITSGETGRRKRVRVSGVEERAAQVAIDAVLADGSRPGRR